MAGYLGNAPTAVPLTSADITDSTITNADIANSTINLTQKVTGTLPVANGGTGLTALGTASQVLRVNSGATALEFGTVSSDFVRLSTSTISANTTSVSFDGYFTSDYDTYILYGNAIEQDALSVLRIRLRKSNADVTSSNYNASAFGYGSDASSFQVGKSGGAEFDLTSTTGSNTNYRTSFQTIIYRPLSTYYHQIGNTSSYYSSGGVVQFVQLAGMLNNSTTALSGITYYPSTGNFDSGTIVLYGVKK